jgi:hypothetical protein
MTKVLDEFDIELLIFLTKHMIGSCEGTSKPFLAFKKNYDLN